MVKEMVDEPEESRADIKQRRIAAPVAEVFNAFRDEESLARWWGPAGFTNTFYEFDFQTGGRWRHTMHGPDGTDYENESRFLAVIDNEKIVIEHLSGHHFILTLTFEKLDETTIVHWQQLFDTREHYEKIREFVSPANDQNLDKYVEEVKRRKK